MNDKSAATEAAASVCPHCARLTVANLAGHVFHDYIQFWSCQSCGGTWNRWGESHPFFPLAEKLRLEHDAARVSS